LRFYFDVHLAADTHGYDPRAWIVAFLRTQRHPVFVQGLNNIMPRAAHNALGKTKLRAVVHTMPQLVVAEVRFP
jgi:hypothetical protein